jgi:hypothetical protein
VTRQRQRATALAVGTIVLFLAAPSYPDDAEDESILEATLRHAAREARCTPKAPCCFSVNGGPPSRGLASRLASASLKAVRQSRTCDELTLKARRLGRGERNYEMVDVAFGPHDSSINLTSCTYSLRLSGGQWKIVPSETICPIM